MSEKTMTHDDLIAQLRDVHQAPPPSWWPPAPGYYLLVGLVLVLAALIMWALRAHKRMRVRKRLLAELDKVEQQFLANQDKAHVQAVVSALFRRLAFHADNTLSKNSELDDVLPILHKLCRNRRATDAIWALLKEGRFKKDPDIDATLLINLSREQIKRCRI